MGLFTVDHHHYYHLDQATAEALVQIKVDVGALQRMMRNHMIDTSKLLAVVAREQTDNDSLRALVAANTAAWDQVAIELKKATDALANQGANTTDLVALQATIDKASDDLSLDSDKTEKALAANIRPAPVPDPAPTPPAAAPTDGPAPLAGTGETPPASDPA